MVPLVVGRPPFAPGTASGIEFTVPVGVALLKNLLNAAAINPAVSVIAVPRNAQTLAGRLPVTSPVANVAGDFAVVPVRLPVNVVVSAVVIVVAAFVPAMNRPLATPGTTSGRELTVPVGVATLKNFLNAAAIRPEVSVRVVPRI